MADDDESEYWTCLDCCYSVSGVPYASGLLTKVDAHEETGHHMRQEVL